MAQEQEGEKKEQAVSDVSRGRNDEGASSLVKWGDSQQYQAEPMDISEGPQVHLLWMTPDPLGAIAAACKMYEGKVVRSLGDITDEDRRHYWQQARSTHLTAPLEFVKFHFMIEGVDRALTHQMVRQRTAVFAQESLRFAVKENLADETPRPPSIVQNEVAETLWDECIEEIEYAYSRLVNAGIPAEDARGLLPHATTTRLHYCTDLRNLIEHAGNRLCTQAQFHWRLVFMRIAEAIGRYADTDFARQTGGHPDDNPVPEAGWQFQELASGFRPVCYLQGQCPFNAVWDRDCSIRERVRGLAASGVPDWENPEHAGSLVIRPSEWLADPNAARRQE